jgi:hypothetical protein
MRHQTGGRNSRSCKEAELVRGLKQGCSFERGVHGNRISPDCSIGRTKGERLGSSRPDHSLNVASHTRPHFFMPTSAEEMLASWTQMPHGDPQRLRPLPRGLLQACGVCGRLAILICRLSNGSTSLRRLQTTSRRSGRIDQP